jgi:hypothetical protein
MFQIKNKNLCHFILSYKLQLQHGARSWSHAKRTQNLVVLVHFSVAYLSCYVTYKVLQLNTCYVAIK